MKSSNAVWAWNYREQIERNHLISFHCQKERRRKMGKIVSQKLATKDCWIFSKSFYVFAVRKNRASPKKEKVKSKDKKNV
jgi:hypothetical protein